MHLLNLNDRPFNAIKSRSKTVEVRANKEPICSMKIGDLIQFTNNLTGDMIICCITKITLYNNVRELLLSEGIDNTLSSKSDIETGIKNIESIPGYKEIIDQKGVYAISISELIIGPNKV